MNITSEHIDIDQLEDDIFSENAVSVSIARLDKIHPEVSGNKIFKLHYFIKDCLASSHKKLITFGGAWSNHLVATAFLCKEKNIHCIGIVRGERPAALSQTLKHCEALGMELEFISRDQYKSSTDPEFLASLAKKYGHHILVPEGGYSNEGARGAALISGLLQKENATHLVTAVGTATTLAGLLMNRSAQQEIIAVPAIKNMIDIPERIKYLIGDNAPTPQVFGDYHFGGYAKYDASLIDFMNQFYSKHAVPTDFVYTAKMMFGVTHKIKQGYFPRGSHIVCLHTGGLQGNASLPPGTLIF